MSYDRGVTGAFGLRKLVSDRIARLIDWRINNMIPAERLSGFDHRLDDHQRRLDALEHRANEAIRVAGDTAHDLERLVPMVSAQEGQLQALRDKLTAVPAGAAPEMDEARSLIDEIRREHAQIRVRLTGVAQYEERLRRLEDRASEPATPSGN
jgi:ABC-type transporter Mla subunit MlaD